MPQSFPVLYSSAALRMKALRRFFIHRDTTVVFYMRIHRRPWRDHQAHVNELEADAIFLAVRWTSQAHGGGYHVVLSYDSGFFLGVLATGRSSRSAMMRYARHISAILLAFHIELVLVHFRTDANPADGQSRNIVAPGFIVWTKTMTACYREPPRSETPRQRAFVTAVPTTRRKLILSSPRLEKAPALYSPASLFFEPRALALALFPSDFVKPLSPGEEEARATRKGVLSLLC